VIDKNIILREEVEFPRLFANVEETNYGLLFYNESNKDCNDANHAWIYPEKMSDPGKALDGIRDFYLAKEITPLIFHPFAPGYFEENRAVFEQHGWEIFSYLEEYSEIRIMVLTEPSSVDVPRRLDIRRLREWDDQIAKAFGQQPEEPYLQVNKACLQHENFYCFVGYLDGKPVTHLSFHVSPLGCTRFDDIETAQTYRGQGYGREMMRYAAEFCRAQGFPQCYQWPANTTSERMTYDAGFRFAFALPGHVGAVYKEGA